MTINSTDKPIFRMSGSKTVSIFLTRPHLRNNPANQIADEAKYKDIKYHDFLRGKGKIVRIGNRAWYKWERYLSLCEARRKVPGYQPNTAFVQRCQRRAVMMG